MGSGQGWFESDSDYRDRIERESNERIIADSTGSAPKQGWFESDDAYASRIADEANERTIESNTGSAPSQGWFESNDDYRSRIEHEANVSSVSRISGETPRQGWFEGDDSFNTRMRQEANEQYLANNGQSARQGWFEDDYAYRQRINQEANRVRAYKENGGDNGVSDRHRSDASVGDNSESSSTNSDGWDDSGVLPIQPSKGRQKRSKPQTRNPIWDLLDAFAEKHEIESHGGRKVDFLADGRVQEKVSENTGSGFSITTYTHSSRDAYDRHQQLLKALGAGTEDA
jgi:hypothetical protein